MDYPGKVITKNQVTPTQTSATGVWTLDDAAAAVKNNNWPVAGVPNPISKSLRFNSADTPYLNRTPASAGNRKTWTWSGWIKRSSTTQTYEGIFQAGTSTSAQGLAIGDSTTANIIAFYYTNNDLALRSTQVLRDVSAWYHIVVALDTTQATASNRLRIYLNGSEITTWTTDNRSTAFSQNSDQSINNNIQHIIGNYSGSISSSFSPNGYLTEINFIDGQALTPSSFGMTDPQTGVWEPIRYTGTYGTNGFYLNFKDATSTTTLGNDYSGNANNWTTNNFSVTAGAGNDSLTDVPTPWIAYNTTGDVGGVVRGNYATWNPLDRLDGSLANGNLDSTTGTVAGSNCRGTFGMSSGKWYFEVTPITNGGIADIGISVYPGTDAKNGTFYTYQADTGNKSTNSGATAFGATYTTNDVIGVAYDADAGKVWFAKNGTWQASGNPASGTNEAYSGISTPAFSYLSDRNVGSTCTAVLNAGQRPFAYTPPAGFRSLCTTNLPNPTIGTSTTTQANVYFTPKLYTGTGSIPNAQTVGFAPDFIWFKSRTQTYNNYLFNTITSGNNFLQSNNTNAEGTSGDSITFDANGFTITAGSALNEAAQGANNMVAWCWRGSGSNATNTSGTITSTVRANTTAGFSIVTFNIPGSGTSDTVGHGLGVAPSMVILKPRTAGTSWGVYHSGLTSAAYYLTLQTTNGQTLSNNWWNSTAPTSSVFTIGSTWYGTTNAVAYCFAAVAGYSAFGSYTGNGSTDGPFVYTGFRPRWILTKRTDSTSDWHLLDTSRDPYNVATKALFPNSSSVETSNGWYDRDFLSNGFKIRASVSDVNASGGTYIYAAFAEFPFKFANAR